MRAPQCNQVLVIAAQRLVPRNAGPRLDLAAAPRHVLAVGWPGTAAARDLLTVVNDRYTQRRHLQCDANPEPVDVIFQQMQSHRLVVARQVMREVITVAYPVTLTQIGCVSYGPATALDPALATAAEREVETRVHLIVFEPLVEHPGIAAPYFAQQEKVLADPGPGLFAVQLPEVVLHVFDGIETKPVQASALGEPDIRIQQVPAHVVATGVEIRQPPHLAGERVGGAVDRLLPDPAGETRIRFVLRAIPRMVINHVEQYLYAALVRRSDERRKVGLGTEVRLHPGEILGPVAM